jgi:X-X-X-Leu-X-X-Gly heptad repeat protein
MGLTASPVSAKQDSKNNSQRSEKTATKENSGRETGELPSGLQKYSEKTGELPSGLQKMKTEDGQLTKGLENGRKNFELKSKSKSSK